MTPAGSVAMETRKAANELSPNPPVNADAHELSVRCEGWAARAGYWER